MKHMGEMHAEQRAVVAANLCQAMCWRNVRVDLGLRTLLLRHAGADKVPPAWDPGYHGSAMMVPVIFVAWVIVVMLGSLLVYVGLRLLRLRRRGSRAPTKPYARLAPNAGAKEDDALPDWPADALSINGGADVEMAAAHGNSADPGLDRHLH